MKIKLINSNLNDNDHPSETAWNNSRPNNSPLHLKQILSLDLPVNEMPTANLFIESTILEREIFLTPRNHSCWAQTSRVQDVLKFTTPEYFDNNNKFMIFSELSRAVMSDDKQSGIKQDEYRKYLPIMSNTKYTVNLSMRDLIHFYKFFERLSADMSYSHLLEMCKSAMYEIYKILKNVFEIDYDEIKIYKPRMILNHIKTKASGVVGDTLVINTNLSINLRAQLARHRSLHLQDNLLDLMKNKSIINSNNELMINVQVSGLIDDWIEIIRKRSCWIAHYSLWKDLLNKAEKYLSLGKNGLPCHDGNCPYDGDARARYTKEDPNPPCPIHAKMNNIKVIKCHGEDMYSQLESDQRSEFWIESVRIVASKN